MEFKSSTSGLVISTIATRQDGEFHYATVFKNLLFLFIPNLVLQISNQNNLIVLMNKAQMLLNLKTFKNKENFLKILKNDFINFFINWKYFLILSIVMSL